MLDIKFIRDNKEMVQKNCVIRNVNVDVSALLVLDDERKSLLKKAEELRALRNSKSKGKPSPEEIVQLRNTGGEIKIIETDLAQIVLKYNEILHKIPNLTHPDSPIGGEQDFKIIFETKKPKPFKFSPKDHEELMLENDLIDFERGAKVATSKFYFFKNKMVRLNQALINYGMDITEKYGYALLETPDLAKNEILTGIGYNPRGTETQVYSVENTDLSLIGTAEIAVGGFHSGEILDLSKGPKKYVALSHCFRTEAGAYGRVSKGLYRVHQFSKLEMFVFCKPEDGEKYHQEILEIEKKIVDGLEVPYRIIDIASGDLGGPAYRKYDIEAWMVMNTSENEQGGFGEITSASNCTDYQARRLNIRYRKEDGTTEFAHTLNGTAIALSRFPIAIIENHQNKDGSISVPKALRKYADFNRL
ncbi:serine--tRNA ligase [Patescibacteria group bacterium]|nr:serine--tRNA ligase [Patescibacteria group bacterium]MBU1613209.1 serine--tRNA ligase [Patescibacteria group bacterium]